MAHSSNIQWTVPSRRTLLAAVVASPLAGCSRRTTYRYKLTLSVNTPDGVKTGHTVVEVLHTLSSKFWGSMGGGGAFPQGEALYLDLGPSRRPLIALLTRPPNDHYNSREGWSDGGPYDVFRRIMGERANAGHLIDSAERFKTLRGAHPISLDELPHLVTFDDPLHPPSVLPVDPRNLVKSLGRGVSWRSMTIEITDEPVTKQIETKLPWLRGFTGSLAKPGEKGTRTSNDLAATLGRWNLKRGD